jgi:O-methyltransferase domain
MTATAASARQGVQSTDLPPAAVLYQLSIGHYVSRALHVAAKLGLADLLAGGPRDAAELAKESGTHAPAVRRVMRLLASAGIFEELEGGRFALLPLGALLRRDVPGSAHPMVLLFAGHVQESWRELEFCLRTGEPGFRRSSPGLDAFAALERDPEAAVLFDEAMATFAPQLAAAIAAAYDFSSFATVVDVGGGNGSLLIGILEANPRLWGVVFDQPRVAERAKAHVAAAGLADRCSVAGGSFFEAVPSGGDAYLLKHVIHDWDDRRASEILANVREEMPPHGKLLVVEGVYPERVDTSLASRGAAANDVNMLVVTGGRQRSAAEFEELYAASAFRLTRIVPTASPAASVIEGEPR